MTTRRLFGTQPWFSVVMAGLLISAFVMHGCGVPADSEPVRPTKYVVTLYSGGAVVAKYTLDKTPHWNNDASMSFHIDGKRVWVYGTYTMEEQAQ